MEHWKLIVERKDGTTKLPDGIFIFPIDKLEKEFTDFLLQHDGKSWNNNIANYGETPRDREFSQGTRLSIRWARTAEMSEKLLPYLVKGSIPDTKIDRILTYSD